MCFFLQKNPFIGERVAHIKERGTAISLLLGCQQLTAVEFHLRFAFATNDFPINVCLIEVNNVEILMYVCRQITVIYRDLKFLK